MSVGGSWALGNGILDVGPGLCDCGVPHDAVRQVAFCPCGTLGTGCTPGRRWLPSAPSLGQKLWCPLGGLVLPCVDRPPAVYLEDHMATSKKLRNCEERRGKSRQFQWCSSGLEPASFSSSSALMLAGQLDLLHKKKFAFGVADWGGLLQEDYPPISLCGWE